MRKWRPPAAPSDEELQFHPKHCEKHCEIMASILDQGYHSCSV